MEKEVRVTNRIVWFEIPVQDMNRACAFYESLFDETLKRQQEGPEAELALFAYEGNAASGCLMAAPGMRPHTDGARIYLAAGARGLDTLLARTEAAGGAIVTPPVALPDGMGRFAHIRDSEGNIIGLHED